MVSVFGFDPKYVVSITTRPANDNLLIVILSCVPLTSVSSKEARPTNAPLQWTALGRQFISQYRVMATREVHTLKINSSILFTATKRVFSQYDSCSFFAQKNLLWLSF